MAPIRDSMDLGISWWMAMMTPGLAIIIFPILILTMCGCCDQEKKGANGEKKGGGTTGGGQNKIDDACRPGDSKGAAVGEEDSGISPPPDLRFDTSSLSMGTSINEFMKAPGNVSPSKSNQDVRPKEKEDKQKQVDKSPTKKLASERQKSMITSSIGSAGQSSKPPTPPRKQPTSISQSIPSRKTATDDNLVSKSQYSRGQTTDDLFSLVDKSKSR